MLRSTSGSVRTERGMRVTQGREEGWAEMQYEVDKSREAQASISEFCTGQVGRNNTKKDI